MKIQMRMSTRTRMWTSKRRRMMTRTRKKTMMRLRMIELFVNKTDDNISTTFTCPVAALCAVAFTYWVD